MSNLNNLLSMECKAYLQRIEKCMNSPYINDWEECFLESIKKQVSENRTLVKGQVDKFEQVEYKALHGEDI